MQTKQEKREEILSTLRRYLFKGKYSGLNEDLAFWLEELRKAEAGVGGALFSASHASIIKEWQNRERQARKKCDHEFFADVASVLKRMKEIRENRIYGGATAVKGRIRDVCASVAYRVITIQAPSDPLPSWATVRGLTVRELVGERRDELQELRKRAKKREIKWYLIRRELGLDALPTR